jgi:hypothetical protein
VLGVTPNARYEAGAHNITCAVERQVSGFGSS